MPDPKPLTVDHKADAILVRLAKCRDRGDRDDIEAHEVIVAALLAAAQQAREEEREVCEEIADRLGMLHPNEANFKDDFARGCAAGRVIAANAIGDAIRARTEETG